MIKLREFQDTDFEILLDLAGQAVPFAPKENQEWFEYRKSFDDAKFIRHHYIIEENSKAVAYGSLEQQNEDIKSLRIFIVCRPEHLSGEIGNLLYNQLLKKAKELFATELWARELQADLPINKFLSAKGFVEKKRFKLPNVLPMVVFSLKLT